MKVLFVLPCNPFFPSGIVRGQRYFPYLEQENIQYRWVNYNAPFVQQWLLDFDRTNFSHVRILDLLVRTCIHLTGVPYRWLRLMQILILAKKFDIIFLQSVLLPVWFAKMLCRFHRHVVFDYDDALYLWNESRTKAILKSAWKVSAGSHVLLGFALKYNPASFLLPSCISWDKYSELTAHKEHIPLRLGWIGSVSTLEQLTILKTPLSELIKQGFDFELVIAGARNQPTKLDELLGDKIFHIPEYVDADLPGLVERFDIGLMPLKDMPAERGKCGFKALIYMAGGIPVISSPVGEALHIITNGKNGFLATDSSEWIENLVKLLSSEELRRKFATAGRITILNDYSDSKCFNLLKGEILEFSKEFKI